MSEFETKRLQEGFELAPDGSEIRPLARLRGCSLVHCTLRPRCTSSAVSHRTVDEVWHFIGGRGEFWRRRGEREEVVGVSPGVCLTVPQGTHFQFRNTGEEPLVSLIATVPPWPGSREAMPVEGRWPASQ